MKLADPNAYSANRAVEHAAQGDIHAGIPLVQATQTDPAFQAAGARKRPGGPDPDHSTTVTFTGLAVVLHYTCGITAQPPGTQGYSHEHRLMAPIVSLRELRTWGMGNNELRKIRDGRAIQGFMYLPQTGVSDLEGDLLERGVGLVQEGGGVREPGAGEQRLGDSPTRSRNRAEKADRDSTATTCA